MKEYICYYSCPFCNNPCSVPFNPNEEFNEMVEAESKAEARKFFNRAKMCRNMKITRIEENKPSKFEFVSAEINGKVFSSFEEALLDLSDKCFGGVKG